MMDLTVVGEAFAREVDRLWPDENQPAFRAQCLSEESGEVSRAITKRRHADNASDGLCKGLNHKQWTDELRKELAQTVGVALDIAWREGFDLEADIRECLMALQDRVPGS